MSVKDRRGLRALLGPRRRTDDASYAELAPLLRTFRDAHPSADEAPIVAAYQVAHRLHAGQLRNTGEPYITHPLAVAHILADLGMDAATLAAALLHDCVEDTEISLEELEREFGSDVAYLIDGVTKLSRLQFETREAQQSASIRKMVIAMARDIRVLLIKLADRLHNVRTAEGWTPERAAAKARETLDVYAPLAHRLGVQAIRVELEDRCFALLEPKKFAEIASLVEGQAPERQAYVESFIGRVRRQLADAGIRAEVTGRPKHIYSVYEKMVIRGVPFEEIADLIGIRVITPTRDDCYAALGVIHGSWPPVPSRFKDYVAMPKFNLYQSLHTAVVGPGGRPVEVQIRSIDMHRTSEYGIASHWKYKEANRGGPVHLDWVDSLASWQGEVSDPAVFLESLKIDLYKDEVFVFTPQGDVVALPARSCPIDFAYAVHTQVGHRCVGARVDGRLVSLDTELRSGDTVEILTSKAADAGPSRDWLAWVRSSKARSCIRHHFARERREDALEAGREQLMNAMRRAGLPVQQVQRAQVLEEIASEMHYADVDAMIVGIGEGHVSPKSVAQRVQKLLAPPEGEEHEEEIVTSRRPRQARPSPTGVVVEGLDDVWVRLARCCTPVPGDDILGFVTRGRGVSVHRTDCANAMVLRSAEERVIEATWDPTVKGAVTVSVQVEAFDRPYLLRDVSAALSAEGINILGSSSWTGRDRVAVLRFDLELSDHSILDRVLRTVRKVESVYDAYRQTPARTPART